ncbi:hypothetical protein Q5716_13500 [Protaetiibacter sp. WY-16]|uniref:Uncharacterized protein n=1 Tax=Antiquaquibacter soli TaxID=3064523 RepID=A0ABT9BQC5_9MICO|nr:hypothetical protein [Protaetiibacter sp. WY-16]MDO7883246.1 hypothetical protein [Protaetiibacter sp. WY-16]
MATVDDDEEPELAGYQPHERPLRGPRLRLMMRVVVVLGLVALVLPGILITASTANRTANRTCSIYTDYLAPEAIGFSSRFELVSPSGIGWNCYARLFGGEEVLVAALGLIPGGARIPSFPTEDS